MSSSAIRQIARQTLKQVPGRYKLFLPSILLAYFMGMVNITTNQDKLLIAGTGLVFMLSIIAYLCTLSAQVTMLDVLRGQTQEVNVNDAFRTFSTDYLPHLLALYVLQFLITMVVTIPMGIGFVLMLVSGDNPVLLGLGILITLFGYAFLIERNIAYSQVDFVFYDRLTSGQAISYLNLFKTSSQLMKGNKWSYIFLNLSFLGWLLLIPLTAGLASFYVLPYISTAGVVFYHQLANQ